jgi:hypothetical protein
MVPVGRSRVCVCVCVLPRRSDREKQRLSVCVCVFVCVSIWPARQSQGDTSDSGVYPGLGSSRQSHARGLRGPRREYHSGGVSVSVFTGEQRFAPLGH